MSILFSSLLPLLETAPVPHGLGKVSALPETAVDLRESPNEHL